MPSDLQILAVTNIGPPSATSEELARRCHAGDGEAFNELLRRHGDRVFGFMCRMAGNRQDAEDLTQETFLRAYRSLGRFDPDRAFETWIFAIARHVVASHHRSRKVTLEFQEDDAADEAKSPAATAERTDATSRLWEIARRLKPDHYQALWLHYGEGFEIKDVARIMGRTRVHVKVMLHRARERLARIVPPTGL